MLDEYFRIMGPTKWYEALDEMQKDLDTLLDSYNSQRPRQGRAMKGTTPLTVFLAGIEKSLAEEVKNAA